MSPATATKPREKIKATAAQAAASLFNHNHWAKGREIINAIHRPHARVAIKGCHASSKTFAVCDAILLALYEGGDVITTAPTDDQVVGVIWKQIHDTIEGSKLTGWGSLLTKSIKLEDGTWAIGRSTNQGVRFHGYHARPDSFLLIVVEEAPGVLAAIFDAIDGISSGGDVRVVILGNPDIPSGRFYDAFNDEADAWNTISISAFDNPNLHGLTVQDLMEMTEAELDDNPRPYLATRRWVRDMAIKWGEKDPRWFSKVLGRFPSDAANALIWRLWVNEMLLAHPEFDPHGGPLLGAIDVSGPGKNQTTFGVRQGRNILAAEAAKQSDATDEAKEFFTGWRRLGLSRIRVDVAGIGYYFGRDLARAGFGIEAYNAGIALPPEEKKDRSNEKTKYFDRRSRDMWHLRGLLKEGEVRGQLPPEGVKQMTAPLWSVNDHGEIRVESKDDMLKRGIESPDWLDMLTMLYAPHNASAEFWETQMQPPTKPAAVDPFIIATSRRKSGGRGWGAR